MIVDESHIGTYFLKNGDVRYQITIQHNGLNKYQEIKSDNKQVLIRKAESKINQWDDMWAKKLAAEEKRQQSESKKQLIEEKIQMAEKRTFEAQKILDSMKNILNHTLSVDDSIDWESLKNNSEFTKSKPLKENFNKPKPEMIVPKQPLFEFPPAPKKNDEKYNPQFGFLDNLSKSRKLEKLKKAEEQYNEDIAEWNVLMKKLHEKHDDDTKNYNLNKKELELKFNEDVQKWTDEKKNHSQNQEKIVNKWNEEKNKFFEEQNESNKIIDQKKRLYLDCDKDAVYDYCEMVLSNSEYYSTFPQKYELEYTPENKLLIVDYRLPSLDDIPSLKEVNYVKTRDELSEKELTANQLNKLYDNVLYQIALRTIHELYEADVANALNLINFNGFVKSIDFSTGNEVTACVLSVQAEKKEFNEINLSQVEPKACFKKLKGVGSSKLHSLTPIAPIIKMQREDKRFVDSYEVMEGVDEGYNLATMDWEDFEHFIRELFEQEFSKEGEEVKVTQSSRDGGIDAVIFDPDPIRGGKIVVQAKRYTNTVGVSAVRDLYGTLLNEGANKGILVTTSDYGADAYKFADGKPLVLLNGSNLLFLLEKHGHKARIDLKEAKRILNDE